MSEIALHSRFQPASRTLSGYFADPVRLFTVGAVTIALGYGVRSHDRSPIVIPFLEPFSGIVLSPVEVLLVTAVVLELVRRLVLGDLWLSRSPVSRWVVAVGIICVVYPFVRMVAAEGGFRIPLELAFLPIFLALFFAYLFLFRHEELPVMIWMIIIAGVYKVAEGSAIYFTVGTGWGVFTGWRDGMLLTMMVAGGLLGLIIRNEGDRTWRAIRRLLVWLLPLATLVFLGSMRRSFIFGLVASLPFIIVLLRGAERRRAVIVSIVLVAISLAMVPFIATGMEDRLTVFAAPTREGSSAYRLLELYSVSSMIMERPLTGWPMGVTWQNLTSVQFDIVSGLLPHNIYLYTLLRGGILGLLAWVGLMLALVLMHVRTVRAARTPFERFAALWLTSATLTVIVAGFTSPIVTDRLQLFLAFPFVTASFLPGAWRARRVKA